jgi:LacI family transcriptional regulator
MKKKATIKDIARLAGVSATAVSMALKDHPRISRTTRERIADIAKKLDYWPNSVARSLKSNRSGTLGIVITSIMNPFYPELAKGIEDKAMERGYSIILCSTNYDASRQRYFVNILRSKGVDGIIFSSVEIDDPHIVPLVEDGFPLVLVNRRTRNKLLEKKIDYVVLDNVAGGYMAMDHLYRLGHRRVALIVGSLTTSTAVERTEGAQKALLDCGLTIDPRLVIECNFSWERAYQATIGLLSLSHPPTAIFAQNDYMALGVREAILDSGRRIPQDVALVGFDDIAASAIRGVDVTTINQKKYEMGALAVDILIQKIEGKGGPVKQIVLPPEIIIRGSCGWRLREAEQTIRPESG